MTVENRAGGGGWIGWGSLAQSKPDGYTIGYINVPNIFAGYLDKQSGGNRKENLESFTPLINHVTDYNMWSVKPDSRFKTVKDVIEEAKKKPGTITLNGGGYGTDDHVAVLGIGANNGTTFQMVHFKGTPEGKTQVLGGNIDVYACNVSEGAEDVKAGVIRALGVMSPTRSKFIPERADVPRAGLQRGVVNVARHRGAGRSAGRREERADRGAGEDHRARRSTRRRRRSSRSIPRSSRATPTASS